MALGTNTLALIDASVAFLLTVAVKGVLILMLAAAVNMALFRSSAALRHLVWTLALISVVLLPVITPLTPHWAVPGVPALEPASRPRPNVELPAPEARAPEAVIAINELPSPSTARIVETPRSASESAAVAPVTAAVERVPDPAPSASATDEPTEESAGHLGLSPLLWALLIWAGGVLGVGAWVVLGVLRVRWLGRVAEEVVDGPLPRILERQAAELGVRRRVRLVSGAPGASPMTWGTLRPTILLPVSAVEWPSARLRAVLLHELAHVKRCDCLIQMIARSACALHWFNPLVWIATARLRVERELACDDAVLIAGSRPSDYAGHLLEVARSLRPIPLSGAAVPMARSSQVGARLRSVLDARRRRHALSRRTVLAGSMGTAALALTLAGAAPAVERSLADGAGAEAVTADIETVPIAELPAAGPVAHEGDGRVSLAVGAPLPTSVEEGALPQRGCDWLGTEGSSSTSINVNDDEWRAKLRRGDCELEFDLSGVVTFDDAETEVVSLSPGGEMEIEEKAGRVTRRLLIESDGSGRLERRWYVDGDEREYDSAARAWLSEMILVLHRRVGYQATERAERLLAERGVDGLLQEISQIPSDHTARRYYAVLLSQGDLGPDDMRRIVRQVGQQIESDYELASLLVSVAQEHPLDESVRVAYVEAVGSIDSDYEHRRALSAILERDQLSPALALAMLEQAESIDSDYEMASLLIEILEKQALQPAMIDPFFTAVRKIDSDYEMRRVLDAAIERSEPDQDLLDRSLQAAQEISSDFELARLLIGVAERYPANRRLPPTYLAAARSIDSDHELARVLTTQLKRDDLSPATLADLLGLADGLGSDFEAARLLTAVIDERGLDDTTRRPFFAVVNGIGSDYERGRVLKAVLDSEPLTRTDVEAVLDAAPGIGSDHEMATLLIELAARHPIDEGLRPAFMRAADTIGSEYERGRVLSAVTPRSR